MLLPLSLVVLMISAAACAALIYRLSPIYDEQQAVHLQLASLASCFIAAAAAAQLLLGGSMDSDTLRRMLVNLALYAGIPLVCSALVALALNKDWSKAAWGRWLLVLFASFELCRRSGVGEIYSLALFSTCGAVWLVAASWQYLQQKSASLLLSGILAAFCLVIYAPINILDQQQPALFNVLLSGALLLLAVGLPLKKPAD